MSMHLVGPYMTTTRYNQKKSKQPTGAKLQKLQTEWRAYNKRMRKINCHSAQFDNFDDYVLYTQGKYKPKTTNNTATYDSNRDAPYRRETPYVPSSNEIGGVAAKKESQVYSGGRQLLGIATMHKSNMVPVFADNKEEAKEIAQMRRN